MDNTFGQIVPFFSHHNKVLAFFNAVEVTYNGRHGIFHRFPAKTSLGLYASHQNSLQNFIDKSLSVESTL